MLLVIRSLIRTYVKDEKAQAMTEYGLIIALIAVVVILAVAAIGENLNTVFEYIRDELVKVTDEL
jgi:pilus assembly protein Flp/PilA